MNKYFLSLRSYVKKFPRHTKYLLSFEPKDSPREIFPPKIIKLGMLKWNDASASEWCGPFDGNFCLCKITDYSFVTPLPSREEIAANARSYEKYSIYNILPTALRRIFGHRKDFQNRYFLIKGADGQICSRGSLTHQEYLEFFNKATIEEYAEYQTKIDNQTKKNNWHKETPSREYPVKLFLKGNDDTSYTRMFETEQAALDEFWFLVQKQPNFDHIHKHYQFTN